MRCVLASLAVIASLAFASTAQATTVVGDGPFQTWADEAGVPTPDGTVWVVQDGAEPPYVDPSHPRVIHFYKGDEEYLTGQPLLRAVFLHELGHVYDDTTLRQRTRRAIYVKLFDNSRDSLWLWPLAWGEKFAMAYSYCAMDLYPKETWPWYYGYGYFPSRWKQDRVCALIRRFDDGSQTDPPEEVAAARFGLRAEAGAVFTR
jgi:hypothetical protein